MIDDGLRIEEKEVVICGDRICCPSIRQLPDGRIAITDDYGNTTIMDASQANLIPSAIRKVQEINEGHNQEVLLKG